MKRREKMQVSYKKERIKVPRNKARDDIVVHDMITKQVKAIGVGKDKPQGGQ